MPPDSLRQNALAIWQRALESVRPAPLVVQTLRQLPDEWKQDLEQAPRIRVVGCGKAGAGMAKGLEQALAHRLHAIAGLVNVPEGEQADLQSIELHPARPVGSNHPTAAGVAGAERMLALLGSAGPDDVAICLVSGGGSALLPAPVEGITLEDKQAITRQLHRSGATIGEMNAVRKHLSRVKGGRLAEAFRGRRLISLIISDVVGDPLDVIASGPTVPDPTTYADALNVIEHYRLVESASQPVLSWLRRGAAGEIAETPKQLPPSVCHRMIGSNLLALDVAHTEAEKLGYAVLDLGPLIEGESRSVAEFAAAIVKSIRRHGRPMQPPVCLLMGGETTVTLGESTGKGGRNQEFVLAALRALGEEEMRDVAILSAGTDGEDGPTDAAGALATETTFSVARRQSLSLNDFLARHDAYHFFDRAEGLIRSGLTGTNVMDLRLILVR